jgi:uncharacterized protein YndB with AHSA1/START domain
MVALITFEPEGIGARQVAQARHWHEEALRRHEVMGIREGQGIVAGQFADLAEDWFQMASA